ncbi:DUF2510 domain-containing protein [Homoserinibacter sp. GY 40078]|uniref:DUF2510 domain-containing protein n=1 Tax=Homoserinibacter sp. GY 40078 TaxID=2603275 RepID=UPI0021060EC2|nr:DUF2510 domain-containing protein [Homoserinibacter sp. GY 40078]
MAEEDVQVPAGWYPDPLGLPQLRWWDNHAWTEHTSDARAPMVAQETITAKLAYADDEPEAVVREQLHADADGGSPAQESPFAPADPVLSLEAPAARTRDEDELSPGLRFAQEHEIDDAPQSAPYLLDTRYDDLLGVPIDPAAAQPAYTAPAPSGFESPFSFGLDDSQLSFGSTFTASTFDPAAFGSFTETASAEPTPLTRRAALAENALPVSTGPVWIIAMLPLILLVLAMLFLLAGDAGRDSALFAGVIVFGSYVATVILAAIDRTLLRRLGHTRTANWDWALLGAPVYLIARMAKMVRETGRGLRPFLTWTALSLVLVGAAIAVPGIVMALAPGVFSSEAEQSVAEDARILGAEMTVSCPQVPPMLIGETMSCRAVTTSKVAQVEVSLVRQNGWIDWRVDDWGVFTTR